MSMRLGVARTSRPVVAPVCLLGLVKRPVRRPGQASCARYAQVTSSQSVWRRRARPDTAFYLWHRFWSPESRRPRQTAACGRPKPCSDALSWLFRQTAGWLYCGPKKGHVSGSMAAFCRPVLDPGGSACVFPAVWRVSEWLAATLEMWCPERGCGFDSRALRSESLEETRERALRFRALFCFA